MNNFLKLGGDMLSMIFWLAIGLVLLFFALKFLRGFPLVGPVASWTEMHAQPQS